MVMGIHIPEEEILMEILTKLPVKSIFRFKCVSKPWKTLFSEPYFKRKHLNHAKNQPDSQKLLIGAYPPGNNYFLNFYSTSLSPNRVNDIHQVFWPTISEPFSSLKIYCCCEALFLIGIWTGPSRLEPSMLLLCNPTTSESILLPALGTPEQEFTYGLGYDTTSDDYKVLRIDKEGLASDEILALKSGSWREIHSTSIRVRVDGGYPSELYGKECLSFVNGAFHWFGLGCIFSLNISDETYGRIPLPKNVCIYPPYEFGVRVEVGISVLKGMLCVFNNNEITFNLWIMKEYDVEESWTKLLTFASNGAISVLPLYSFCDGEVLLRYEYRDGVNVKVIYRTCKDRIWPFDCADIDPLTIFMDGFVYTESLINPRSDLKSVVTI